jgi:hypothetical protein
MAKIYISSVIDFPVQKVWEYIRNFNELPKWFPGLTDSKIEAGMLSDQVGCIRDFGLQAGGRVREQLIALSDRDHSFSYRMLEGPIPVTNYLAHVRLHQVTNGDRTFAEYKVEFDCAPGQEKDLIPFLSNFFSAAFEHLNQHAGKS